MTNTEMVDQSTESIVRGPRGREIDVMQTLHQVGLQTRWRIGYVVSSLMYDRDYIKFQVSCGGRRRMWVIVKLAADDTYSIEVGRLQKKFYWRIEHQLHDVYGDQLSGIIEQLFVEVYS